MILLPATAPKKAIRQPCTEVSAAAPTPPATVSPPAVQSPGPAAVRNQMEGSGIIHKFKRRTVLAARWNPQCLTALHRPRLGPLSSISVDPLTASHRAAAGVTAGRRRTQVLVLGAPCRGVPAPASVTPRQRITKALQHLTSSREEGAMDTEAF